MIEDRYAIRLKSREELSDDTSNAALIDLIPDNWQAISGTLCAPSQAVMQGKVACGRIWQVDGPNPEPGLGGMSGLSTYTPSDCSSVNNRDSRLHCPNRHEIPLETLLRTSLDRYEPLAEPGALPCGLRFREAGSRGSELKGIKELFRSYLVLGYTGHFEAKSALHFVYDKRNESKEMSWVAPESIYCIIGREGSHITGALVNLSWNPGVGGDRKNLAKLLRELTKKGFKKDN